MPKFIISIKDKYTGRDVVSPFTINSLNDIGDYAERVASYGCLVIIDSIKEENDLNYLNLLSMKKNDIWKIVIGAVSAALGYILNAIGL